jgi:hypothetical protein
MNEEKEDLSGFYLCESETSDRQSSSVLRHFSCPFKKKFGLYGTRHITLLG